MLRSWAYHDWLRPRHLWQTARDEGVLLRGQLVQHTLKDRRHALCLVARVGLQWEGITATKIVCCRAPLEMRGQASAMGMQLNMCWQTCRCQTY